MEATGRIGEAERVMRTVRVWGALLELDLMTAVLLPARFEFPFGKAFEALEVGPTRPLLKL